ncbi:MAG TPA: hypothetical protein VIM47_03870 [Dermatophilaceae bacterium]
MVSSADQPHPSAEYLALVRTPPARLTGVLRRGDTPHVDALAGWEWRGTNMPATSRLLGLRRFIKGFTLVEDGRAAGYNVSVPGADLSSPWTPRNQCDGRREWASFTITTVDPTATDNRYLHALLLDYSAVASPEPGIAGRLRDYLVRVVPDSDELLLGHAFIAAGPARIPVGWFALERLAPCSP